MNKQTVLKIALASGLLLPVMQTMATETAHITAGDRSGLGLTLYNQNLGLVRDSRALPKLRAGEQIILEDVSQQLQPESLRIANAGQVFEQNLNTNLLNQNSLLQHYIGKTLQLARLNPATGHEEISQVTLLSFEGNRALIKQGNRFETIPLNQEQWRFIYPALPQQLLTKPSLSFRTAGTAKAQTAEISYLTGGLNWNMDYLLTLNSAGTAITIDGMATLQNNTGVDYPAAQISLLAGTVNQPDNPQYKRQGIEAMRSLSVAADTAVAPETLQDFHLYTLPRSVDLLNGQLKQVSLVNASNVPVERNYQYQFLVYPTLERNQHRVKPDLGLRFKNDQKSHLGFPLPSGNLRTFSPDSNGQLQFIGGGSINHTGEDETVEIMLGKAFDVSIHRRQTQFSKTFNGFQVEQELRISNTRTTAAKLELTANFPLSWEMQRSSLPYEKVQGGSARWMIEVPAKGDAVLTFSVQMEKR